MTALERRAATSLAGIFGLRMLGMFLILPVFALYAKTLPGGESHTMVGLALGMYGLGMMIPLASMLGTRKRGRLVLVGAAIILALIGAAGVLIVARGGDVDVITTFLIGSFLYQWLANFVHIRS